MCYKLFTGRRGTERIIIVGLVLFTGTKPPALFACTIGTGGLGLSCFLSFASCDATLGMQGRCRLQWRLWRDSRAGHWRAAGDCLRAGAGDGGRSSRCTRQWGSSEQRLIAVKASASNQAVGLCANIYNSKGQVQRLRGRSSFIL